jgi:hypothetical protein
LPILRARVGGRLAPDPSEVSDFRSTGWTRLDSTARCLLFCRRAGILTPQTWAGCYVSVTAVQTNVPTPWPLAIVGISPCKSLTPYGEFVVGLSTRLGSRAAPWSGFVIYRGSEASPWIWLRGSDLNRRSPDYETGEIDRASLPRNNSISFYAAIAAFSTGALASFHSAKRCFNSRWSPEPYFNTRASTRFQFGGV